MMTDHLSFEQLNDLTDGALSPQAVAAAGVHLAACARCRAVHEALARTTSAAAALPPELPAPAGLWDDVRPRLAPRRRVVSVSFAGLAAAAVLVVALSSAVTALVMRRGGIPSPVAASSPSIAASGAHSAFATEERAYAEGAARLEATLAERRDSLAPATAATVERSLRIADSAIAEARAALEHDPANRAIEAILVSNYERKIDLLRRATELSPRT